MVEVVFSYTFQNLHENLASEGLEHRSEDVSGLELMRCCCYLVAASYFSRFCRRFSVQCKRKFD